jgi:hypothetical protein
MCTTVYTQVSLPATDTSSASTGSNVKDWIDGLKHHGLKSKANTAGGCMASFINDPTDEDNDKSNKFETNIILVEVCNTHTHTHANK